MIDTKINAFEYRLNLKILKKLGNSYKKGDF